MTKYRGSIILCAALVTSCLARGQEAPTPPLKLVATIPVPGWTGHWDHFGGVDLKGNRIFGASEGGKVVEVFDLRTLKHIASLGKGILVEPHSLLYRADLNRVYAVDGTHQKGGCGIFDGSDYHLIKYIDLPKLADWSNYDPVRKYLYINANGINNGKPDSEIMVIDTTSMELAGRISVDDKVIADFALESSGPLMYTGMRVKNIVAVADRDTQKVVAQWPVTMGHGMGHMGIDSQHHRLFVNCRDGQPGTVIFDTQTGKEVGSFPINGYSDELMVDKAHKRIYIVASGPKGGHHATIEAFQQIDQDHYKSLGELATGDGAQTGGYVAERDLIFVGVPGNAPTVLVYKIL